MNAWQLWNADTRELLVPRLELATSFWRRFRGWQGRAAPSDDAGLLLAPCNSIHTCFLRFPLDVVFLDGRGQVLAVRAAIRPWRATLPIKGALATLERPAGTNRLAPGERVALVRPADVATLPRTLADFPCWSADDR